MPMGRSTAAGYRPVTSRSRHDEGVMLDGTTAGTRRCSMAARTSEGFLHGDIPFLRLGQGPPLVMVQGLSPQHDIPQGWQRRMT